MKNLWGYSAVGSAFEWHSKGQGFESPYLHKKAPSFDVAFLFKLRIRTGGSRRARSEDKGDRPGVIYLVCLRQTREYVENFTQRVKFSTSEHFN